MSAASSSSLVVFGWPCLRTGVHPLSLFLPRLEPISPDDSASLSITVKEEKRHLSSPLQSVFIAVFIVQLSRASLSPCSSFNYLEHRYRLCSSFICLEHPYYRIHRSIVSNIPITVFLVQLSRTSLSPCSSFNCLEQQLDGAQKGLLHWSVVEDDNGLHCFFIHRRDDNPRLEEFDRFVALLAESSIWTDTSLGTTIESVFSFPLL